ncbi:MAG: hypothetical protein IAG13_26745 [Deltaproteobacteria bacterium]|nr:hypothetical protein [Nannocystaceae bacterium]
MSTLRERAERMHNRGRVVALLVQLSWGCAPTTTDIDIDVIVPEDADDLEAADNVTAVLAPDGAQQTVSADGLEFSLSMELDPDDTVRDLELYLANDEALLAYGRTPPFTFGGASGGLAVFLARPGALATFPTVLDLPDDLLLGAAVPGRGVAMLSSDGATSFIDGFRLEIFEAEPLVDGPLADDGVLVGDALGGAMRVSFASIDAWRYDAGDDGWIAVELMGAAALGNRADASWLVDSDAAVLYLFGGGASTDVVAIDLVPREDDSRTYAAVVDGLALDDPRIGARASWVTREDGDTGEDVLVFGTATDSQAAAYLVQRGVALGPVTRWSGGGCVQLDPGRANADVRMLCAGGIRDGLPVADGLLVTVPEQGEPTATELPNVLDRPMPEPLWLADDTAVYAQGEGALVPFDRASLQAGEPIAALRTGGGQLVPLEGGATLILGGRDAMGTPTTRIQVFMPRLPSE